MRAADTGMVKWRREAGLRAGDNLPIATATAVGCAFVLLLLPAHGRNHLETAVAAAVGLALVAFARWLPHNRLRPVAVFTPTGGTVALRALPAEDHVLVEVEDSGIGIAADELPRLFDRFYRARSAASRNVDGTGLGLAIAKTIADAHDAQLDVTSKLGHGTSFRLRLATVFVSEPAAGRDGPDRTLARR
jgi:nitrogen-specific signal transduction histidine kinase